MRSVPVTDATAPPAALSGAEPIGAGEFSGRMKALFPSPPAKLAVAVSGGPDSMALAYCLKRWAVETQVMALIVDHALRPESAQEARQTQANLAKIGIEAEVLQWQHPPVVTRLHDSARKARYALMIEACRKHGIHHLLLAHQREDQAETILMRFAKGSGIHGLAGMAEVSVMDDVQLVRPFLQQPKMRLIATCEAAHVPYVTDPSNASQSFARGRLRRVMGLLGSEGFTLERLLDLGTRAGEAKEALDHATDALLRAATKMDASGAITLNLEQLRSAPVAIAQRALGQCLRTIHHADYAPEHASLRDVVTALIADREMPTRTLNGCLIGKSGDTAHITREAALITDRPSIKAGESVVWDQRWQVSVAADIGEGEWQIGPLGNPSRDIIDRLAPGLRDAVSRGRARATLPALRRGNKIAFIPSLQATNAPVKAVLLSNLFNHNTGANRLASR